MQTLLKNYQQLSVESGHEVMMDINTTPLIDVMLVLLIMFIVTIPIQLHSVKLDLPRPAPVSVRSDPVIISLFVDAQDQIHWNGESGIDLAQASQKLIQLQGMEPQPELHVRSHPDAHYEAVAMLMAEAQKSGLRRIGITETQAYQ